jgi:hypothetical protein
MQRKLNTSFIDQYSATFSNKVAEQAFKGIQSITGKDILNVTPSKQVNFFILKILFTNWQEEMKRLESPYFDFKDVEVRKAMVAFMNALSQKISIERKHFQPLVQSAVSDTLLMLADPSGYLEIEFADREHAELTEKAGKTFLKYIKLHKYHFEELVDRFTGSNLDLFMSESLVYFEQADLLEATQNECVVLSEVEKITYAQLFEEEKVEEFEEEIIDEEYTNEPVFAMDDALLEDDDAFERYQKSVAAEEFTEPEDLEEVEEDDEEVDFGSDEAAEEEIEEDEIEEEVEDEPEAQEEEIEEEIEEDAFEDDEEEEDETATWQVITKEPVAPAPLPIIKQEAPKTEEPDQEEEAAKAQEKVHQQLNERLAAPPRTINDRFEEEKVTIADVHQQAKVNNIMDAISVNHRYMFTQELFDGDVEEFRVAIATVETSPSFDAAVEFLVQKYSKVYHWNMNSEEVKELLKVVFRKFR